MLIPYKPHLIRKLRELVGWLLCGASAVLLAAETVDESKLPPPATIKIDFVRDIKPILDTACARCHGPERPKSRFRLDNREAALKGGNIGIAIIPGQSGRSPLIHFVAGAVEDMEMPPTGKGDPLTRDEVALLRAWIDQGAAWGVSGPTNRFVFDATARFGGTVVSGNRQKFREHHWQREGFNGGIDQLELTQQVGPETQVSLFGHAWRDDYKIAFEINRTDVGYIRSGWQEYRKYFDDTGGYFLEAPPMAVGLDGDRHLTLGKTWIDFGLALPNWPQMSLGYEYDYKRGRQTTLIYGPLAPTERSIDEGVHIIKFNLDAELKGISIEERFRGEFYGLDSESTNFVAPISRSGPPASSISVESIREGNRYFQGANTLRFEKKINKWLFGSAGYLYSKLNSDAYFNLDTMPLLGVPSNDQEWRFPKITLEKESHVFNLNAVLGPFDQLTFSTGVQSEWTRQRSFGRGSINLIAPTLDNPASLDSDYDLMSVSENLAVRYTKIPFTSLFADLRLQQQSVGQSSEFQAIENIDKGVFLQHTDFSSLYSDGRIGFTTSPWQQVSFSAHYRRHEDDSTYRNAPLIQPEGFGTAYPAFIRARDVRTDEFQAKLVVRPQSWLKSTLSYQLVSSDYSTDTGPFTDPAVRPFVPGNITPGGNLLSGLVHSHIYSLNLAAAVTPRLNLNTTFLYQPTYVESAGNGFVAPFHGDIYSVISQGSFLLSDATTLFLSYVFSEANYGIRLLAAGLPVGNQYQQHAVQAGWEHRLSKRVTTRLQYGYYYFNERGGGGPNNYVAHSIFSTVNFKLQ